MVLAQQSIFGTNQGETRTATIIVALDGSGDTDDIQEAIHLLPKAGGKVYVRAGTYYITKSIALKSNMVLQGEGKQTIITKKVNTNFKMLDANPAYLSSIDSLTIKDLSIVGLSLAGSDNSGIVLRNTCTNCRVYNVWVTGCYVGISVSLGNNDNILIKNCVANDNVLGISLNNCDNAMIIDCVANDNSVYGIGASTSVDYIGMYGNHCHGNTTMGMHLQSMNYGRVINNSCCDNGKGIECESNCDRCVISHNQCNLNSVYGIWIRNANCDRNIITSNVIYNNTTADLQDAGTNTLTANNQSA